MNLSLDSALGRQRRLNSVGESVLQIAPNAAAAYSLRSLTGGDPKVVRVRRGSDNHEQDFTASEVSSGALTSFVNAQVVAPLDIRALTATGRDGDFLIAKAAYSLRSLGTRQATLAATGDTVARADGKYVVQVRRSSDDALKSFTATEITDGTLLAFVNEIQTLGTVTNSAGNDGFTLTNTSSTGFTATTDTATGVCGWAYTAKAGDKITVSFDAVVRAGTPQFIPRKATALSGSNLVDVVSDSAISVNSTASYSFEFTYDSDEAGSLTFSEGDDNADFDISNFQVTVFKGAGLVKTWYDQSVDAGGGAHGNHAVQATAAEQPKIVNAGSLVADSGIDFDGSQFLQADSVSGMGATVSTIVTSVHDSGGGGCVSLASSASGITNFGTIEGNSVSNINSRNTTSVTASASVSGSTRLTFGLTTGQTLTKAGALGGTLVESTSDYGDDFTSGELNRIIIGKLRASSGTLFDGRVREALVYDTDQTDNRTAIEANIGEAYGIDLPSGVDPGFDQVDGFVETWYDQSGNSKDAIQTTANLQPVIVAAGVFQNGLKFDSDGSSSGPDFRTPIDSVELSNDPAGHAGFALVWVGNVNQSQHNNTSNHTVLGNLRNVQNFSTGTIGLSVIPTSGTVSFINEQGGSTKAEVVDTNALTPGNFGVAFFSYEDAEAGFDPLLSVNGSVTTSGLSDTLSATSTNNIGIMTAITSGNAIQYSRSTDGICKEVLLYTGDQKDKRVALETNIAAEYGITLS